MRLIPLTSSQLAAVGWVGDGERSTMAVVFQNGGQCYLYDGVPRSVFVGVITDPDSQGKAFSTLVKKGGYAYRRSTPEEIAGL